MKKIAPKKPPRINRTQTFEFTLPLPFYHFCKILNIAPRQIIFDFLHNIGGRVSISGGLIFQTATSYIIDQKYGREFYTEAEIRQMLGELGVIFGLCPPLNEANNNHFEEYIAMREQYFKSWTHKWENKCKRNPLV